MESKKRLDMNELSLEEILIQKKELRKESPLIEKKKNNYIHLVNKLYKDIEIWLNKYITQELLSISYKAIELEETDIGKYSINQMTIHLPNEIINLVPGGTMILGSFGCLEIEGKLHSVTLLLIDKDIDRPFTKSNSVLQKNTIQMDMHFTFGISGDKSFDEQWNDMEWKIFIRNPDKPLFLKLDEHSFTALIKELIS